MKKFQIIFAVILMSILLLIGRGQAMAFDQASGSSAKLELTADEQPEDNRAKVLEGFLLQYDSPLAPYAEDFVKSADKYSLDWRLVASIAGLESTFGKQIPYNSYNGWGWGIYGDNVLRFNSWPEAIETISRGLRENYLREKVESDPYFIGPTYAASPTWAVRVTYFMNRIEEYRIRNAKNSLSLAI